MRWSTLIHKYVYADRPREKAAPSIINGTMRLNRDAALNLASVQHQLEWFKAEGLVDASISIDDLVDQSYVRAGLVPWSRPSFRSRRSRFFPCS